MCVSHGKEVAALHPTLSNYISVLEFSGIAASGASLCGSEIMPAAAVRDSEVMPAAIHENINATVCGSLVHAAQGCF